MNVITVESKAFTEIVSLLEQIKKMHEKRTSDLEAINKTSKAWVNNEEASGILKVSKRTLQNYRDKGILGFSQIGNQIYYRLEDIEKLLSNHYQGAHSD
ncbi:MAG: helix-turn-helix domain-containing protein [Bacteroidota bacterium]|nr:helix-turn-helix domain-containing protein [Bacteroidota bacterium]